MRKENKRPALDAEYARRMTTAFAYISRNLHTPITLKDVASASCFSEFHFHRIFHGLVGETVHDYMTRKRMQRAAWLIAYKRSVDFGEVAAQCGYSSGANFSKAFKKFYGVTPSQVRDPASCKNIEFGKLTERSGKNFDLSQLYTSRHFGPGTPAEPKSKTSHGSVKIVELEKAPIVYTISAEGYLPSSVQETWNKLRGWAQANEVPGWELNSIGICYDDPAITPPEKCRYEAGFRVDRPYKPAPPMLKGVLPGGKYAVSRYEGPLGHENIGVFYRDLYAFWFAFAQEGRFEPDSVRPFEHYLNDPQQDGYLIFDLYIKVKELETRAERRFDNY